MDTTARVFLSWLKDNYPTLFLIILIIALVWWIASKYYSAKGRIEKMEQTVKGLPCESHKNALDAHSAMKEILDSINEQVSSISKWILEFDNSKGTVESLVQKFSPRNMTALGRNLFAFSGAKETIEKNESFFLAEVEKKGPATPFDVEQASLDVIFQNIGNPIFNDIKNFIYFQPEEIELTGNDGEKKKVKISLYALIQLMGLDIRDRYLAHHPEVNQTEVTESVTE